VRAGTGQREGAREMGDAKASTSGARIRRRVLALSAGASHTVALLCKNPSLNPCHSFLYFFLLGCVHTLLAESLPVCDVGSHHSMLILFF
jgi:hypothetical protein